LETVILVVAIAGIAAAFGFFILELTRWRRGESFITRYHKGVRVVLFVLAELLMGLMLYGAVSTGKMDPLSEYIYWSGCTLVGIAVVIVAWLDLREVLKGTRRILRSTLRGESDDRK
jgi:hypothetical protein